MMEAMYKRYETVKPAGGIAFCNTFGMLVFNPDDTDKYKEGCDLICCWAGTEGKRWGFHKHMVHYSPSGRAYIRKGSMRVYLDDIMKY